MSRKFAATLKMYENGNQRVMDEDHYQAWRSGLIDAWLRRRGRWVGATWHCGECRATFLEADQAVAHVGGCHDAK